MFKIYPLVDGAIDTDNYFKNSDETAAYEIFNDLVTTAELGAATTEVTIVLLEDENEDDDISENATWLAEHTIAAR